MNKVKYFITIFPILLFSYILFCFSSCSMKAEQKSLTVQFEGILRGRALNLNSEGNPGDLKMYSIFSLSSKLI